MRPPPDRRWPRDLGAALAGLALLAAALYVVGALMIGVRLTMCEDQCQADRLAAVGRKL